MEKAREMASEGKKRSRGSATTMGEAAVEEFRLFLFSFAICSDFGYCVDRRRITFDSCGCGHGGEGVARVSV